MLNNNLRHVAYSQLANKELPPQSYQWNSISDSDSEECDVDLRPIENSKEASNFGTRAIQVVKAAQPPSRFSRTFSHFSGTTETKSASLLSTQFGSQSKSLLYNSPSQSPKLRNRLSQFSFKSRHLFGWAARFNPLRNLTTLMSYLQTQTRDTRHPSSPSSHFYPNHNANSNSYSNSNGNPRSSRTEGPEILQVQSADTRLSIPIQAPLARSHSNNSHSQANFNHSYLTITNDRSRSSQTFGICPLGAPKVNQNPGARRPNSSMQRGGESDTSGHQANTAREPCWCVLDGAGATCASLTWLLLLFAQAVLVLVIFLNSELWFCLSFGLLFELFWLLAISSHLKAMLTNPGTIPLGTLPVFIPSEQNDANDHNASSSQNRYSRVWRRVESRHMLPDGTLVNRCARCASEKPQRAHHCSICNRCVMKMDHHCPWVNNCVGEGNQKFFILFNVYIFLSAVSALLIVIRYAIVYFGKQEAFSFSAYAAARFALPVSTSPSSTPGTTETPPVIDFGPGITIMLLMLLVVEALLFGCFSIFMAIDQICSASRDTTGIEELKMRSLGWDRSENSDSQDLQQDRENDSSRRNRWANISRVFAGNAEFSSNFSLLWLWPFSMPRRMPPALRCAAFPLSMLSAPMLTLSANRTSTDAATGIASSSNVNGLGVGVDGHGDFSSGAGANGNPLSALDTHISRSSSVPSHRSLLGVSQGLEATEQGQGLRQPGLEFPHSSYSLTDTGHTNLGVTRSDQSHSFDLSLLEPSASRDQGLQVLLAPFSSGPSSNHASSRSLQETQAAQAKEAPNRSLSRSPSFSQRISSENRTRSGSNNARPAPKTELI